ncbi:hypothetical protein S7711_10774 [Stachybotrys chartarum IBT 7711]|uniref:Uncharacterized protein n=1 Tax=Stachybotrys chartarum (strain CBS 109288 / IBT 7711) TaxID=1280523 RepID=A0A084AUC6_STACB|nr:hypothetical protein S7711_10774 [Stachybotrys chartarum IBT 7711]KFA46964.1 hypothetical protein S40293_10716 [Stachybotrys chartarum IBT 40293]
MARQAPSPELPALPKQAWWMAWEVETPAVPMHGTDRDTPTSLGKIPRNQLPQGLGLRHVLPTLEGRMQDKSLDRLGDVFAHDIPKEREQRAGTGSLERRDQLRFLRLDILAVRVLPDGHLFPKRNAALAAAEQHHIFI